MSKGVYQNQIKCGIVVVITRGTAGELYIFKEFVDKTGGLWKVFLGLKKCWYMYVASTNALSARKIKTINEINIMD